MTIQPVAAVGKPTLTIESSNESQSVGSNCGTTPPTAGIGRKIRFPAAAAECTVRGLPVAPGGDMARGLCSATVTDLSKNNLAESTMPSFSGPFIPTVRHGVLQLGMT